MSRIMRKHILSIRQTIKLQTSKQIHVNVAGSESFLCTAKESDEEWVHSYKPGNHKDRYIHDEAYSYAV